MNPIRRFSACLGMLTGMLLGSLVLVGRADASCGPCEKLTGCTVNCGVNPPPPVCLPDPAKDGTVCRAGSGDLCDPDDTCSDGICGSLDERTAPSTTVCRPKAGACDVAAEKCTGVAGEPCPADTLLAAGTVCRAASGTCDVAETCNGTSGACPANAFQPAGTLCRSGSGACDVAETCSGTSGSCPSDGVAAAGTQCRAAAGVCDVAETCDGGSKSCPSDVVKSAGTECRAASGVCDVAETCDGSSTSCPSDVVKSAGTECRAAAGACDVAETCNGSSTSCPSDSFKGPSTVCRSSAGVCDVAETCTGGSAACPSDGFVSARTECRAAAGACDVPESCTGSSPACPSDGFASAGTECRAAAGECDQAESCSGSSAECPSDALKSSTTVCRLAAGACDVAETCTGSSTTCPPDAFASAATVCRAAGGECDPAETCSGDSATCAANAFSASSTPCTADSDACTLDVCNGSGLCVHEPATDSDGDGDCDARDDCTNPGGAQNFVSSETSMLKLVKINTNATPGDDGLALPGDFLLPAGSSFSGLDPIGNGARLVLRGAGATIRVDQALPGGAYEGGGSRGWKINRPGTVWTYQDTTGTPLDGITRMTIADRSKKATGQVKVTVKGVKGTYPVLAADVPVEAIVVLGGQAASVAGECGESAFAPEDCKLSKQGDALACKR